MNFEQFVSDLERSSHVNDINVESPSLRTLVSSRYQIRIHSQFSILHYDNRRFNAIVLLVVKTLL